MSSPWTARAPPTWPPERAPTMSTTRSRRSPSHWLLGYRRTDLAADLRAGVSVGVLIVPQSMAYAALAGVPPVTGLYAAIVALVVYAALGTSRFVSVGPVALDSLLTAAAVAPLADGDPARYLALASLTALLVGVLQAGAGLLGLGALVGLLSVPVVSGFTSAAAITIALSQLPPLLGMEAGGSGSTAVAALRSISEAAGSVDAATAAVGGGAVLLLVVLRRVAPQVPAPLAAVTLTALVVVGLGLDGRVDLIGAVPGGLPPLGLPRAAWADVAALLPSAAAIALIGVMETVSTGTVFARRRGGRIDPAREMVAVGGANVATGLAGGLPVAGGLSRGAVNVEAGARTQLSNVVAAAIAIASLLALSPILALLPRAALAAVVLVPVLGLVDWRGALRIGRVRGSDLVALLSTAAATLVWGPALGLGAGAVVSLVLALRSSTRPHLPELGRMPQEGTFRSVERFCVLTDPAVALVRIDAPLTFASTRPVRRRLEEIGRRPGLRHLVVDCSAITSADFTGVDMLAEVAHDLDDRGVDLHLAEVRGPVRDVLARHPALGDLGEHGRLHPSLAHAVERLAARLDVPRGPA